MQVSRSVALLDVPFRVLGPTPLAPYRLGARLRSAGLHVRVQDLKPILVAKIGRGAYRELSENHEVGKFGEWLFSSYVYGDGASTRDDAFFDTYASDLAPLHVVGDPRRWLRRIRDQIVPEFLQDACTCIEAAGVPAAIGFACESFQTNAALALGRRLKRRHPQLKLVLGGVAVPEDARSGPSSSTPWIDAIALSSEGELLVPLFQRLVAG
ncbi:hypothetical protein [Nannocystis bainbridge]|uniref:Radical SAM protein n=1 Tax=Nannocystis bainbridge TaxID=2995303 RepID=A0ABT5EFF7_9BACT|nr:hypothetical protein [Nannocystis bainbridge]MDC0723678.1 hypothetical protein [Nannocystis bainbridge]